MGQMVHLLQRHIRRVGNGGVTSRQLTARPRRRRPYEAVHPLAEGINVLPPDGKTGRQLVTAEAVQQVRAGFQRRKTG